jgi:hypothetical protein
VGRSARALVSSRTGSRATVVAPMTDAGAALMAVLVDPAHARARASLFNAGAGSLRPAAPAE